MRGTLVALCLFLLGGAASSWVGHQTELGQPLAWDPVDLPLAYVIQEAGSDDVSDGTDLFALQQGFDAWSAVPHSALTWARDTDPVQTARVDWEADDIRLVLFDEDGGSGLFPPGSGLVAVTVFEFDAGTGAMLDADVLLNGDEYSWSTDLTIDTYDVRAAAAHEAGHAAGLAHSPLGGATMAPFVSSGAFTMRMLHNDDAAAVETRYPSGARGEITGSVALNGLPMAGAHVWCSASNGLVVSSTLTALDGSFTLTGLDPGSHAVMAAPLESPLSAADIGALGALTPNLFFRQVMSAGHVIVGAESLDIGVLAAADDSAIVALAPQELIRVRKNATTEVTLEVAGLVGGTPSVSVPASGVITIDNVDYDGGSSLSFDVVVPIGSPSGAFDLAVQTPLGTRASLPGFLVVVPPQPSIDLVAAACGGSVGSEETFVQGTALADTVEYVFGTELAFISSVASGGKFVGGFPPDHPTGTVDVICVNDMGDEARLESGFLFVDGGVPIIHTVFPEAGDINGGTLITIAGTGFGADSQVYFGATPAASMELISSTVIHAVTPGIPPGSYDVTVLQAGCESDLVNTAFDAFQALTLGPDPTLSAVAPDVLSQMGGEGITVTGAGFVDGAVVELFNDPVTGLDGTPLVTTFVDSGVLTATTPVGPLPGGYHAAVVRLPGGQAALLPDAVEVNAPTLTEVTPTLVSQAGGVTLTLTGTDFVSSAVVELFTDLDDYSGGLPLTTTFVSDTELTAEVPTSLAPLAEGLANVAVIMDGPLYAGLEEALEIVAPRIAVVSPTQLSPSGGETLTLTGFGFTPDATVRLFADPGDLSGGTPLAATIDSATQITVTTPIGPLPGGLATIAVDLPGGLIAAAVNAVDVLFPTIDTVGPALLASSGNEGFTITGSHFVDGAVVELRLDPLNPELGTPLVTSFVNSATLNAITPPGPLPLVNVDVVVRMANDVLAVAPEALGFAASLSSGNKASGELGEGDECDEVVFDGLAGTLITVNHRRVGKTDLIPKLMVLDPDDAVLVSTDEADPEFDEELVKVSDKSALVRKLLLPVTGRYRLLIKREAGAGPYKLSFREKLPLEARRVLVTKKDEVSLGPGTHELRFDAKAGTRVSGSFRGSKKDGLQLVLATLEDPEGFTLLQTLPDGTVQGDANLIELVTLGKDLISVRFKQVTLPSFGSYRLLWGAADGTSGTLTGRFGLRAPKVKASYEL